MNPKVNQKLKAVSTATRALERAHKGAGRIAIRNARRSLWARVRAFQEECDVQYRLPDKEPPPSQLTLDGQAKRMTASGFDRAVGAPAWWIRNLGPHHSERESSRYFQKLSEIVSAACAQDGVPIPRVEAAHLGVANIVGSGVIGLKDLSFGGFVRAVAKWIMHNQGLLHFRDKRRPGSKSAYPPWSPKTRGEADRYTEDMIQRVNLKMAEVLRLTGYAEKEQAAA